MFFQSFFGTIKPIILIIEHKKNFIVFDKNNKYKYENEKLKVFDKTKKEL